MLQPTNAMVMKALRSYPVSAPVIKLLQAERDRVYLVRDRAKAAKPCFVLRISSGGSQQRQIAWSQCQWLRAIDHDTNLVVPKPVPNESGEDVTQLGNNCWCMLFRHVEGKRRFWRRGPGRATLRQVGQIMARLHEHGRAFDRPKGFLCRRWGYAGLFGANSPWAPQRRLSLSRLRRALFDRIMRRARQVMEQLGQGPDVFGLIHGDLMQANYLVHRGSVRPIDFGDWGLGYFLYDMGITLLMLRPFDASGAQRRAFVEGYRDVRALTQDEEALLDIFIAARAVALMRSALGAKQPVKGNLQWVQETLPWLKELPFLR